jgi:transposase InsO family protein
MPWSNTNALKERIKFALEWEARWDAGEGRVNVSELSREFGISRQAAARWIARFEAAGRDVHALEEGSHRPRHCPHEVPEAMQDAIVVTRKKHPTWGPRKLRAYLIACNPGLSFPAESTIAAILHRNGLTSLRRRRRRRLVVPATKPFASATGPNAVWCVDFKGWFRLGNGKRCYPLTLIDAYSRYLLRCEALLDPDTKHVQPIFDSAFEEFGTPTSIRSDNGPPFASTGPGGLTKLSVWWRRLGIQHDRIEPGKPQQNGRQERFHRTLAELVGTPERDITRQQRAFDRIRREYNDERPHEALALKPPVSAYAPSEDRYPRKLLWLGDDDADRQQCIDRTGHIRWSRRRVFISTALAYEPLTFEQEGPNLDSPRWLVRWGGIVLGHLDDDHLDRGLIPLKRRR